MHCDFVVFLGSQLPGKSFHANFSAHKQFLEDLLVPPIAFVFSSSLFLIPGPLTQQAPSSSGTLIPAHLGHSLLVCFSCLTSPAFLQHPGSAARGGEGGHHSQWSRPSHINLCLRKCPKVLPTVRSYGEIFLNWSSILSNDFSLCRGDIKK